MLDYDKELEKEEVKRDLVEDILSGGDGGQLNDLFKVKSGVVISEKVIEVEDIVVSNFKSISRSKTLIGLTGVIGEWGVVSPIHVMQLEDDDSYMLLDGLRRIAGALRNGEKKITAKVWEFEDIEEGKQLANLISLMINRSQRYKTSEIWEQMQILESVNGLNPSMIEYLLQMNSGDAMKLKDIMLADIEYSEIQTNLLEGVLNIEGAYRKLCNERKKENRLAKEDLTVIDGSEESLEGVSDAQQLSVDDVKELLDIADNEYSSLKSMDRSSEAGGEPHVQKVGERHPLDPDLRREVLERDGYKCRCCGVGGQHHASVIAIHHLIPVFLGGADTLENLICICVNHHLLLHNYASGKIKVDLDKLSDVEKEIFRNIFKYGNIIIEASKRVGVKSDDLRKASASSMKHPFPDQLLKQNKEDFKNAE